MGKYNRLASIAGFLVGFTGIVSSTTDSSANEAKLPDNELNDHRVLRKGGDVTLSSTRLSMLRELLDLRFDNIGSNMINHDEYQRQGTHVDDNIHSTTSMPGGRRQLTARDGEVYSIGIDVTAEEDGEATLEFVQNLGLTDTIPEPKHMPSLISSSELFALSSPEQGTHETVHRQARILPKKKLRLARTPRGKGKGKKSSKKNGKGKGGKGASYYDYDYHYYDYDYDYDYHHHHDYDYHHHHDYDYQSHNESLVHAVEHHDYDYHSMSHDNDHHHHEEEDDHHHHEEENDHHHHDELAKMHMKQFTLLSAYRSFKTDLGTGGDITTEQAEVDLFNTSGNYVGKGYISCYRTTSVDALSTENNLCNVSLELINNGITVAQIELSYCFKLDGSNVSPTTFGITGGSGKFSGAQGSGYFELRDLNVPAGCISFANEETLPGPYCVSLVWYVTIYEYYDDPYPGMNNACSFC